MKKRSAIIQSDLYCCVYSSDNHLNIHKENYCCNKGEGRKKIEIDGAFFFRDNCHASCEFAKTLSFREVLDFQGAPRDSKSLR